MKIKLHQRYFDLLNSALETQLKEEIVVATLMKDWTNRFSPLNDLDFFQITTAMLNGFELLDCETEAKEKFNEEFNYLNFSHQEMYRMGMADFADAHEIYYDWLNPKNKIHPWLKKEDKNESIPTITAKINKI